MNVGPLCGQCLDVSSGTRRLQSQTYSSFILRNHFPHSSFAVVLHDTLPFPTIVQSSVFLLVSFNFLFSLIVKYRPISIQRLLSSPPQPNFYVSSNSHAGTNFRNAHYALDFSPQLDQVSHLRQARHHSNLSRSNLPNLQLARSPHCTPRKLTTHLLQSSVLSVVRRPSSVV